MNNYSNNIFKYNNKKFIFFATLFVGNDDNDLRVSLDMNEVEEFVYENELNSLCLDGHIIYTDKYAQVDKFLNQHFAYCSIQFCENDQKNDSEFVIEHPDVKKKLIHTFIVSSIQVISREYSVIKYRINLVSNNWFKCRSNIYFSNYSLKPQSVFDILKSCLANRELLVDNDSFSNVTTPVVLQYITNNNDNMFTVAKYLMHKLYYFSEREQSMKFFLYDETDDNYKLFDMSNKATITGTYTTILSFFKTNNEVLIQQEPTNIGYACHSMSKTNVYSTHANYIMHDFSYDSNAFSSNIANQNQTVSYMNSRFDIDGYENKFIPLDMPKVSILNQGSYWNNAQDIYDDSFHVLERNNSLILNITGEVLRKPGSLLVVALDRSLKNGTSEDKKDLETLKKKYKAYEGTWVVLKVQNLICPNQQSYRQQILVARNYIPKLEAFK